MAIDRVICCYFQSWSIYRPDPGTFNPEDIPANRCTHVNYSFLGLNNDGTLRILDPEGDITRGNILKVSALKQKNPRLKTIFSIGGYSLGTEIFTAVSSNPTKRANLAKSAIQFCKTYNYDGIDIDWEYPQEGDRVNYITLLKDLRNALKPHGYIITAAVSAIPTNGAYDVRNMSNILDLIHVMTYDFHLSTELTASQNSPLYAAHYETEWQRNNLNCNSSINNWIQAGADPRKLTLGIAFYGHAFKLTSPLKFNPGAPTRGPANGGPFTNNPGTVGYNELCYNIFRNNAMVCWDDEQMVPYLHNGDLWVGYDNPRSVAEKVQYAKRRNLAGVFIWSIDTDDSRGFDGERFALLNTISMNM